MKNIGERNFGRLVMLIFRLFLRITLFMIVGMIGLTIFSISIKDSGILPSDLQVALEQSDSFFSSYFLVVQRASTAIITGYAIGFYQAYKIATDHLNKKP